VLNLQNVLREDAAKKLLSREELLSNAPEQYDGYFQVPGTLG
jgi:aspartyl/glutamyl-tRNA(Asn/Gln) amidotransferase C subunit